jgi:hypothetical protein
MSVAAPHQDIFTEFVNSRARRKQSALNKLRLQQILTFEKRKIAVNRVSFLPI